MPVCLFPLILTAADHIDPITGKFDWAKSGRFPSFTTPAEGYHGLIYSEAFPKAAYGVKLRIEVSHMNQMQNTN